MGKAQWERHGIKMYYPEELVEEVRQRSEIVGVISSYVKLSKKGSTYMGLCPFHSEKSPSFAVNGPRQMYHCFGCGVGGNVVTFIMEYENFTFPEAIRFLAERAGIPLPEAEYSSEARKQADIKGCLLEIHKAAANYFYYQLKSDRGSAASLYLKNRELTNETIQKFGLGYSNKFSDDLYQFLKKKGYEDDILSISGLVAMDEAKGPHDKFWNRVMFPIMDVNNKVIGFGGRVLGEGSPKYLNSQETKIFDKSRNLYGLNLARLSRKRYVLLCEGYMDVIALHQAGFQSAVASLGTAFTGLQANLIKRYADEVYITYDSDEAGTKAALRAIPILKAAGLLTRVLDMKPYKDPDEFIKALGAEEFEKRIQTAKNSFYFEIEVLEKNYDLSDPEQKTRFYNETAKKLLVFTEELERNNYIEAIAEKYRIQFEDLRRLVNKFGAQIVPGGEYRAISREDYNQKSTKTESGILKSQKIMLTWLIEDVTLFDKLKGILSPEDFSQAIYHQAAELLFSQYEKEKAVNPARIINYFEDKEEQKEAASLFNSSLTEKLSIQEREKALNETLKKIKKYSLDEKSRNVTDVSELQHLIQEQADLQKMHISL